MVMRVLAPARDPSVLDTDLDVGQPLVLPRFVEGVELAAAKEVREGAADGGLNREHASEAGASLARE